MLKFLLQVHDPGGSNLNSSEELLMDTGRASYRDGQTLQKRLKQDSGSHPGIPTPPQQIIAKPSADDLRKLRVSDKNVGEGDVGIE